ncbi:MAG: cytochrome c oxidase assembly protein [Gaiellaceae bacterium]
MRPDPYAWSLNAEALLGLTVLAGVYAASARRFPRSPSRIAAFAAAVALLAATEVTPLHALSFHLLSMHLLQNVVLAEWAPALLVLGVTPAAAAALGRSPVVRVLTWPPAALALWLATYFAWHVPAAYDAALRRPDSLLHLEHTSYVAAGCLVWWPVLQNAPHRLSPGGRASYLFAAFVLASPLGLLLALLPDSIYDYYDGSGLWGLSPLTDQQIAGVTMAGEQAIVFFAAFAWFFFRFLAEQERDPHA